MATKTPEDSRGICNSSGKLRWPKLENGSQMLKVYLLFEHRDVPAMLVYRTFLVGVSQEFP